MPVLDEPSSTYREAMPDSSKIAKNLDDFRNGLLEIENPDPEYDPTPDLVVISEPQSIPETEKPKERESLSNFLETPLGDIDLPKKDKVDPENSKAVVESSGKIETIPEVSDQELAKQFPKKDKDARSEFIRMRKEIKRLENEKAVLEPLKSEIETLRTKKPEIKLEEIPEYIDLQNQLKERDDALHQREEQLHNAHKIVALADFKKTPEYENSVIRPWKEDVLPVIDRISKEKEINGNILLSLIQNRDPATRKSVFNEIVQSADLTTYEQQELIKAMQDYDSIAKRHTAIENEAVKLTEMSDIERKRNFEVGYKEYRKIYQDALKDYRPKLQAKWFPNLENDNETQAALSQINERVDKADWHSIPPQNHAPILQAAATAPLLEMIYSAKYKKDVEDRDAKISDYEKKIKDLETSLTKMNKSTPSAGSQGSKTDKVVDTTKIGSGDKFNIRDSIAALE